MPHSDIHGSKPARGSPWLFAACHVLHRLLVPRHPPNALIMLDQSSSSHQTTTMHGNHPQPSNRQNPIRHSAVNPLVVAHNRFSIGSHEPINYLKAPLNSRSPTAGTHPKDRSRKQVSVRQAARQRDIQAGLHPQRHRTRPETHQNLIYFDKEQHIAPSGRNRGRSLRHRRALPTNTELSASLRRLVNNPTGPSTPKWWR